jgi:gag-polypeptide of LTR copia-type
MANDDTINTGATSGSTSGNHAGETSIRVVIFNGKKEQWESWKEKFLVRSSIRGYEDLITGDTKAPATHDKTGKKKVLTEEEQKLSDLNKKGFGDLILSIDCNTSAGLVAFAMVKGSKTKENPSGHLFNAFTRLKNKYEPNTTPQLMHLTKEFHSKVLKPNQDPDIYITDLEALQVRMEDLGHSVSNKTLILQILNNLGKEYEMEVKMLEMKIQQLMGTDKELSIDDVRTELSLRYK